MSEVFYDHYAEARPPATRQAFIADRAGRHGVAIFPVQPDTGWVIDQVGGVEAATADLDQIEAWWETYPRAGIGLPCGPSGVGGIGYDVLSVDPVGGVNGLARAKPLADAGLLTGWDMIAVKPSGGVDVYFPAAPAGQPSRHFTAEGIRLYSQPDQYVLAPPSVIGGQDIKAQFVGQDAPASLNGAALEAYFQGVAGPGVDQTQVLYTVMDRAWRHWLDNAERPAAAWARRHMAGRGLAGATFGVASSTRDDLLHHLAGLGHTIEQMQAAGLVTQDHRGRLIDRFRDRICFPVYDAEGRVVAVTARINPANPSAKLGRAPKYLNSPTTPIYTKSQHLYGLSFEARTKLAAGPGRAIPVLVEGPMDAAAIERASAGRPDKLWPELVGLAPCGTSLTTGQLDELRQVCGARGAMADGLVFAFDGDDAGQNAVARATIELLSAGERCDVWVYRPDCGKDPAEWLAALGPGEMYMQVFAGRFQATEHGQPWPQWIVDRACRGLDQDAWLEERVPKYRAAICRIASLPSYAAFLGGYDRLYHHVTRHEAGETAGIILDEANDAYWDAVSRRIDAGRPATPAGPAAAGPALAGPGVAAATGWPQPESPQVA
jgi:hypothetical protein